MSYARFGSIDDPELHAKQREYLARAREDHYGALAWEHVPGDLHGSSVYVFFNVNGFIECCGCSLAGDLSDPDTAKRTQFYSTDAIIAHLKEHEAHGDDVPGSCYARLESERKENDAELAGNANKNVLPD